MEVTQSVPHPVWSAFDSRTFRCSGCGDVETRLQPRGKVSAPQVMNTAMPSSAHQIPKPLEKIALADKLKRIGMGAAAPAKSSESAAVKSDMHDLLRDPKKIH